jgi:hypothetical protein
MILLSCSSQENQLVGTWEQSDSGDSVVLTLHSDGTFVAQVEKGMLGGILVEYGNASGTWKVGDGRFIGRVTESTIGLVKVGHTWSDEIVQVSNNRLVLRPQSGEVEEYKRTK